MSVRCPSLPRAHLAPPADIAGTQRLLLAIIVIVPLALIFGSLAGFAIGSVASPALSYRDQRLTRIAADLLHVDGDYVLAAGDSHIVRWRARAICGLPIVNAGIDGATAGDTDDLLGKLVLPRPPRAVILTVGTNDAARKRFREPQDAIARFQQAYRLLLRRLSHATNLVIVTGVPHIDARQVAGFSAQAATGIGAVAEAACRSRSSCRVANSFSDGDDLTDGLHLADYEHAYGRIAPTLCAALDGGRRPLASASQNADAGAP